MIKKKEIEQFRSQWEDLEVEVVGMAPASDGAWVAADGADLKPRSWDAILIGRTEGKDQFDILELAEDVSKKQALKAAQDAAALLNIPSDDILIR